MKNCSQNLKCREALTLSHGFLKIVSTIFLRPFPSLGTTLTFLSGFVFTDNGLDYEMTSLEETSHDFLAAMLRELYNVDHLNVSLYDLYAWGSFQATMFNKPKFSLSKTNCTFDVYYTLYLQYEEYIANQVSSFPCQNEVLEPCCNVLAKSLIRDHLEMFTRLMKHSQITHNFVDDNESAFLRGYAQKSRLFSRHNLTLSLDAKADLGMILFCDFVPDILELRKRPPGCSKFKPVSTANGICHSFNALPATATYENLPYLQGDQIGQMFTLGDQFFYEVPQIFGLRFFTVQGMYIRFNFDKNVLGYILGIFKNTYLH
jgi:hypothetical protein